MCLSDITGAVAPGRLTYETQVGCCTYRAHPGMDKGNNVFMTGMCFIAFQTKATNEEWSGPDKEHFTRVSFPAELRELVLLNLQGN